MGSGGHCSPSAAPLAGQSLADGHVSVLYDEVLDGLAVRAAGRYIDGTLGAGGHAAGILARSSPDGVLLGLDADRQALARASRRLAAFGARAALCQANFRDLAIVAREHGFGPGTVDGIVLDLGLSSPQLADPARGFSFASEGPLDMRFDPAGSGPTAADLVNGAPEEELSRIFLEYGEDDAARRIARRIVEARTQSPITTTTQLAAIVRRAKNRPAARSRGMRRAAIDPATLAFQALRIAVNSELASLSAALPQAIGLLRPGGRLAVIAFHSLEDRIVKQFMRQEARSCLCPPHQLICTCGHQPTVRLVNRGAVQAGNVEVEGNRRARSARLRIAERL